MCGALCVYLTCVCARARWSLFFCAQNSRIVIACLSFNYDDFPFDFNLKWPFVCCWWFVEHSRESKRELGTHRQQFGEASQTKCAVSFVLSLTIEIKNMNRWTCSFVKRVHTPQSLAISLSAFASTCSAHFKIVFGKCNISSYSELKRVKLFAYHLKIDGECNSRHTQPLASERGSCSLCVTFSRRVSLSQLESATLCIEVKTVLRPIDCTCLSCKIFCFRTISN